MNNKCVIALFIKTVTERTFQNLKLTKMLVKVKYLGSFQI